MGSVERAEEFARALREEVVRLAEEDIDQVVRATAIKALDKLIGATPVDTGYARAGWQVSMDAPSMTVPPEDSKDKDGQRTFDAGMRELDRAPQYPHIFFSNNVPYIEVLDDGRWAGESVGEGGYAFGAGVNGPARRTGARGSVQAAQGILQPVFDDILASLQQEESA